MTTEGSNTTECPICFNIYSLTEIDSHVNKCLFLNTQESPSSRNAKRSNSILDSDNLVTPVIKKPKHEEGQQASSSGWKVISNNPSGSPKATVVENEAQNRNSVKTASVTSGIPLAEQVRPDQLAHYIGQQHVLGTDTVLRTLLLKHEIPSMILWGPPGCGKTTLAHIIAAQCRVQNNLTRFVKLSATMCGINEVKEVVKVAANELRNFKRRSILFMDEIHRFNKLQQDIFLPHVESGTIILIGATTENPSFSLNSALLSRCRVIPLEKLQPGDMMLILKRALKALGCRIIPGDDDSTHSSDDDDDDASDDEKCMSTVEKKSVQWLADMCDGDARNALNSLQMALRAKNLDKSTTETFHLSLDDIRDGIKRSHLMYDKKGDEHYNIISAVHKSIRASDDNAALYWVTRMLEGGEDPVFVGRRLVRAAAEDIGLADPQALPMAVAAMQGCQLLGMPECDVLLAQCAVYLARAPKSQEVYRALLSAKSAISQNKGPQPGVPLHLRNSTSRLTQELGWGVGYNMRHKDKSGLNYLPDEMGNIDFFQQRR